MSTAIDIIRDTRIGHPGLAWRMRAVLLANDGTPDALWRGPHVAQTVDLARRCRTLDDSDMPDARKFPPRQCEAYRRLFERRKAWLTGKGAALFELEIEGRLFTASGDKGIHETNAQLHCVTGMPTLSASSIKGLLRAWCMRQHALWLKADPEFDKILPLAFLRRLFGIDGKDGTQPAAGGLLQTHDAWWSPDSKKGPLAVEVDTPHHPAYYAGRQDYARGTDDPNPNPQLAIAGALLFAIDHVDIGKEWADTCMHWLKQALDDDGAGGRRMLGYGRFAAPFPGTCTEAVNSVNED